MKSKTVRTSIELPRELHRKLRAEAAKRGCSMRNVVVDAIERAIVSTPPKKGRLILEQPLLAGDRRKVSSITNDEIYELGFP